MQIGHCHQMRQARSSSLNAHAAAAVAAPWPELQLHRAGNRSIVGQFVDTSNAGHAPQELAHTHTHRHWHSLMTAASAAVAAAAELQLQLQLQRSALKTQAAKFFVSNSTAYVTLPGPITAPAPLTLPLPRAPPFPHSGLR